MTFTRRWFLLFTGGFLPLFADLFSSGWSVLTLLWLVCLFAVTLFDFLRLPPSDALILERAVEPQMSLGAENPVRLILRNATKRPWRVTLHDEPPADMTHDFEEMDVTLEPERRHTVTYHIKPKARGDFTFGQLWLRVLGSRGLVARQHCVSREQAVKVYPNLVETAKFTLMARRGRLEMGGIRAARLIGAGREFESLRDYQPDDEYRRIDWKATARRGKLVSRQYEVEKSQNVILVLDVGRTMLSEIDGIAKLDYAVNAALLLAYVATLSDDNVGLLVFDDQVRTWIPPKKGRGQVYRLLDALYNAKANKTEPDYRQALGYVKARWRRRSLMICFTDLWDPDSSQRTIAELISLQPRHLVACVTLMDTNVLRRVEAPLAAPQDAYERAVALQVLNDREKASAELKLRGVLVVDTPADKLSAALVNRYLEVKEKMML